MPIPDGGRVLSVDWGTRRFGMAVSDPTQRIAFPDVTLTRRPGKRFPMPAFLARVAAHAPCGVVVGLPLALDGTEGAAAADARSLADLIARRTGLPVDVWDERLSTKRALASVRTQGHSPRDRPEIDARAAALFLQHWLDARRGTGQ